MFKAESIAPAPNPNGIAIKKKAQPYPSLTKENNNRAIAVRTYDTDTTILVENFLIKYDEHNEDMIVHIDTTIPIYPAKSDGRFKLSAIAGNELPSIESGNPNEMKVI